MIEVKRIIPECNADTLLAELLLQKGVPQHQKGVTKVSMAMQRFDNDKIVIFGLIDKEPFKRTPTYIKEFSLIVENREDSEGLILKRKPDTEKYIIYICPEFAQWVWQCAVKIAISPADYGFESYKEFFKASKRNEIRSHPENSFRNFIKEVISKEPTPVITIKKWMSKVFE